MRKTKAIVALILIALSTACSDEVDLIRSWKSQDGQLEVQYAKIYYGGAAGGTTHCVNFIYQGTLHDCAIAMIHISSLGIQITKRAVEVEHCGGEVTANDFRDRVPPNEMPYGVEIIEKCE